MIVKAAGTRVAIESSYQHERGLSTDFGSARQQHQLRADPNDMRRLREGMCFVIGSGRVQRVQIAAVRHAPTGHHGHVPAPHRPTRAAPARRPGSTVSQNGGHTQNPDRPKTMRNALAEPLLDARRRHDSCQSGRAGSTKRSAQAASRTSKSVGTSASCGATSRTGSSPGRETPASRGRHAA
jgi:hypothetical protein